MQVIVIFQNNRDSFLSKAIIDNYTIYPLVVYVYLYMLASSNLSVPATYQCEYSKHNLLIDITYLIPLLSSKLFACFIEYIAYF